MKSESLKAHKEVFMCFNLPQRIIEAVPQPLIALMGSAFLWWKAGIESTVANSVVYLKG